METSSYTGSLTTVNLLAKILRLLSMVSLEIPVGTVNECLLEP